MSPKMNKDERETFLADVHVAIISIPEEGRGPLTIPVWYNFEPGGEIIIWTGGSSRKVKLLRQTDRFSLCVQQEERPYKYVSVEGQVVSIGPIDLDSELRPLIVRHIDAEQGEQYLEELGGDSVGTGDVAIR